MRRPGGNGPRPTAARAHDRAPQRVQFKESDWLKAEKGMSRERTLGSSAARRPGFKSAAILPLALVGAARAQEAQPESTAELQQRLEQLEREVQELKDDLDALEPGTSRFLLTGRASVNFTAREGDDSTFGARVNPALLWKLSDELFAGTSFELRLEDDQTDVDLQWAYITVVLNDHLMIRGGLFLTPLS